MCLRVSTYEHHTVAERPLSRRLSKTVGAAKVCTAHIWRSAAAKTIYTYMYTHISVYVCMFVSILTIRPSDAIFNASLLYSRLYLCIL